MKPMPAPASAHPTMTTAGGRCQSGVAAADAVPTTTSAMPTRMPASWGTRSPRRPCSQLEAAQRDGAERQGDAGGGGREAVLRREHVGQVHVAAEEGRADEAAEQDQGRHAGRRPRNVPAGSRGRRATPSTTTAATTTTAAGRRPGSSRQQVEGQHGERGADRPRDAADAPGDAGARPRPARSAGRAAGSAGSWRRRARRRTRAPRKTQCQLSQLGDGAGDDGPDEPGHDPGGGEPGEDRRVQRRRVEPRHHARRGRR